MRLLVDQNLSSRLAAALSFSGHDAIHTEDAGLSSVEDPTVLEWCCGENRLLVTADKKLTKFLASSGGRCPSVLIARDMRTVPVELIAAILIANLAQIERIIGEYGNAIFSIAPDKPIRAQLLPLGLADEETGLRG